MLYIFVHPLAWLHLNWHWVVHAIADSVHRLTRSPLLEFTYWDMILVHVIKADGPIECLWIWWINQLVTYISFEKPKCLHGWHTLKFIYFSTLFIKNTNIYDYAKKDFVMFLYCDRSLHDIHVCTSDYIFACILTYWPPAKPNPLQMLRNVDPTA